MPRTPYISSIRQMKEEKSEFIGGRIRVIESSQKSLEGIEGTVVDETKNTLTVLDEVSKKRKRLIKSTIIFTLRGKRIDGKSVALQPHERIKRTKKG